MSFNNLSLPVIRSSRFQLYTSHFNFAMPSLGLKDFHHLHKICASFFTYLCCLFIIIIIITAVSILSLGGKIIEKNLFTFYALTFISIDWLMAEWRNLF